MCREVVAEAGVCGEKAGGRVWGVTVGRESVGGDGDEEPEAVESGKETGGRVWGVAVGREKVPETVGCEEDAGGRVCGVVKGTAAVDREVVPEAESWEGGERWRRRKPEGILEVVRGGKRAERKG